MKKNKLLIICGIIAAVGVLLCGIGFLLGGRVYGISMGRDGLVVNSGSSTNGKTGDKYVSVEKDLEAFDNLKMDIEFADVKICESDHYGIEYHLRESRDLICETQGDTMIISQKRMNGSFSIVSIGSISFGDLDETEYVILYVPKGAKFGDFTVKNESGTITMNNLQADKLSISDSFGSIKTGKLEADTIKIDMESGKVDIAEIAAESFEIEDSFGEITVGTASAKTGQLDMESGNIIFENIESEDIKITASFGDVKGDILKAQNIQIDVESGFCKVKDLSGTVVQVGSQFGGIELGLQESVAEYSVACKADFGEININGEEFGEKCKLAAAKEGRSLTLDCESGDIKLTDVNK